MAFDPTLPANNSPIISAELRNQLAGLKELIDAQQATIDSQQTQINDHYAAFIDLQDSFSAYVASHP